MPGVAMDEETGTAVMRKPANIRRRVPGAPGSSAATADSRRAHQTVRKIVAWRCSLGRAVVDSLQHARDDGHPGLAGTAASARSCPFGGHRSLTGDPHVFLRADDPRLSRRRRRLHRRPGQSGGSAGTDGRRGAADRLCPDGSRVHLVGRGPNRLGLPRPVPVSGVDRRWPGAVCHAGQPAGVKESAQSLPCPPISLSSRCS